MSELDKTILKSIIKGILIGCVINFFLYCAYQQGRAQGWKEAERTITRHAEKIMEAQQ